jgi:epsin
MNYTEYEIKVRDATNNDPWGASSTLMNEIASATWHFHHFSEIMTTIYKRLEESHSDEWRKVYKALQLLEYLLKNGSDNVLDSVKTHARDIAVLESFHYIDEKGKDQGINVRHRAKEILELVNNPTKLNEERVKSKENKSKYTGVSSSGMTFSSNFSEQNFSSQKSSFTQKKSDNLDFEKYKKQVPAPVKEAPPPVQEVDLLNFDDFPTQDFPTQVTSNDDWGDFTTASSRVSPVVEAPTSKPTNGNTDDWGDFSDFKSAEPVVQKTSLNAVNTLNTLDFQSLQINSTAVKKEEKDPYSKLVNLDSLGSFSVKPTGPSLADLGKK